jgi:hypothetical protein
MGEMADWHLEQMLMPEERCNRCGSSHGGDFETDLCDKCIAEMSHEE